jgi:hypothetical protein
VDQVSRIPIHAPATIFTGILTEQTHVLESTHNRAQGMTGFGVPLHFPEMDALPLRMRFSRMFRGVKGLTPKDYRRKYLGRLPELSSGSPPFGTEFLDGDLRDR